MSTDSNANEAAIEAAANNLFFAEPDEIADLGVLARKTLADAAITAAAPILEASVWAKIAEEIAQAIEVARLADPPFVDSWISGTERGFNRGIEQAAAIARQHATAPAETAAAGQTGPDTSRDRADSPKPAETPTAARALFRDCPECGRRVTAITVDQTLAITSMPCGHIEADEGSQP